jgi:hypothetical protein
MQASRSVLWSCGAARRVLVCLLLPSGPYCFSQPVLINKKRTYQHSTAPAQATSKPVPIFGSRRDPPPTENTT